MWMFYTYVLVLISVAPTLCLFVRGCVCVGVCIFVLLGDAVFLAVLILLLSARQHCSTFSGPCPSCAFLLSCCNLTEPTRHRECVCLCVKMYLRSCMLVYLKQLNNCQSRTAYLSDSKTCSLNPLLILGLFVCPICPILPTSLSCSA